MKKFILIFLGVVVLLFVSMYLVDLLLVGAPLRKIGECFRDAGIDAGKVGDQMKTINDKQERLNLICKADNEDFPKLTSCLSQISDNYFAGTFLLKVVPSVSQNLRETVTIHNKVCPNSPLIYPTF